MGVIYFRQHNKSDLGSAQDVSARDIDEFRESSNSVWAVRASSTPRGRRGVKIAIVLNTVPDRVCDEYGHLATIPY